MDVLRPPMVHIGNRSYRKTNVQGHSLPALEDQEEYFNTGRDCDEFADESCTADSDIEAEIKSTSKGYVLSFHVANVFHKFIVGRKGETKKRLETETRTQIKVPRHIDDEEIGLKYEECNCKFVICAVITGVDKAGVRSAKTRVDVLIASARRRVPFTHFLSLPVNDDRIRLKLEDFKRQVLQSCGKERGIDSSIFQNGYKLHMTVGTMVLLNEKEVQQAIDELEACKKELIDSVLHNKPLNVRVCGLEYMNDDPDSVDVLFAKVSLADESNRLQLFADRIVDQFVNAGIMRREYERVKLHVTVMNSLMRKDPSGVNIYQPEQLKLRESFNAANVLKPKAVMFSCMDSRLIVTRLIQADVGDMFLVRNAGNLVPNNDSLSFDTVTTEPGALELGCVINKIRHVIVCGHSDCKAMNLLYSMRESIQNHEGTPLQTWLKRHGARSIAKFNELEKNGGVGPITFQGETYEKTFKAYIDPENKFAPADKLSQVNTLQQIQNIASYGFLKDKLKSGDVRLHAVWFDIYSGDFYMFSRTREHYLQVTEEIYEHLMEDGDNNPHL